MSSILIIGTIILLFFITKGLRKRIGDTLAYYRESNDDWTRFIALIFTLVWWIFLIGMWTVFVIFWIYAIGLASPSNSSSNTSNVPGW